VDYLRAFKPNAEAINLAGGYAGGSIAAAKLVAKEQDLNYNLTEPIKHAKVMEEAVKRYLAALAFTGLNSKRHKQLKANVNHNWVRNNTDSLPHTYERLMEMVDGYKTRDRPHRDPQGAGVTLINTTGRCWGEPGRCGRGNGARRGTHGRHGEQERGKNEDGGPVNDGREYSNVNNDGQKGCWNCGSDKHWKYQCPKLTEEERAELQRKGGPSLLNIADVEDDIYGAEDEYDGVVFVLPVMV
jgi:hypothetical protein